MMLPPSSPVQASEEELTLTLTLQASEEEHQEMCQLLEALTTAQVCEAHLGGDGCEDLDQATALTVCLRMRHCAWHTEELWRSSLTITITITLSCSLALG